MRTLFAPLAPLIALTRLAVAGVAFAAFACASRGLVGAASAAFPGCRFDFRIDRHHPPTVALTIDDAPDAVTTPAILDTLRAYGAHATFFVISDQLTASTDSVMTRLLRDGHEIGNHGTRDRPAIRLDSATFASDLREADAALRDQLIRTGKPGVVRWARPGSGLYSRAMLRTMHRMGYECALGSIYPLDAELAWPWLSERYILGRVRPGGIVILHDRGSRGQRTARVLGRVLSELRTHGYRIVTLTELAAIAAERTTKSVETHRVQQEER
jgi:peptidoglycan/xylan/chitin deacetylase (PgdA/CDA1 family)